MARRLGLFKGATLAAVNATGGGTGATMDGASGAEPAAAEMTNHVAEWAEEWASGSDRDAALFAGDPVEKEADTEPDAPAEEEEDTETEEDDDEEEAPAGNPAVEPDPDREQADQLLSSLRRSGLNPKDVLATVEQAQANPQSLEPVESVAQRRLANDQGFQSLMTSLQNPENFSTDVERMLTQQIAETKWQATIDKIEGERARASDEATRRTTAAAIELQEVSTGEFKDHLKTAADRDALVRFARENGIAKLAHAATVKFHNAEVKSVSRRSAGAATARAARASAAALPVTARGGGAPGGAIAEPEMSRATKTALFSKGGTRAVLEGLLGR